MPFKKGQSGNPGGRPKEVAKVRELAQAKTAVAIQTLVEIAENKAEPASARVAACNAILDRACGKPVQGIAGDPDSPLFSGIERMIVNTSIYRG